MARHQGGYRQGLKPEFELEKQRIVITGSSGRIGRSIHALLSRTCDVVGVDRVAAPTTAIVTDIGNRNTMRQALSGADAIIHVAALHAPQVDREPDSEFDRINVQATSEIIDAAAALGIPRIVFTSTTALYGFAIGAGGGATWIDERLAPLPRTVYHRTKLAAEELLIVAARSGGPTARILRMSRCFPEPAPLMAVYRLHRGVDARDVADAHARALDHAGATDATFVVSYPGPFERGDLPMLAADAQSIIRLRAPRLASAFDERGWTLPESIDRVYDASLAVSRLGWRPRFGFDEVLAMHDTGDPEVLRAEALC